jgi:hypothetical protein
MLVSVLSNLQTLNYSAVDNFLPVGPLNLICLFVKMNKNLPLLRVDVVIRSCVEEKLAIVVADRFQFPIGERLHCYMLHILHCYYIASISVLSIFSLSYFAKISLALFAAWPFHSNVPKVFRIWFFNYAFDLI